MTAFGGDLADYSESDVAALAEPVNRAIFRFAAHGRRISVLLAQLYPVPADLAGLLDPSVPPLVAGVSPAPASPAIPTST